MSGPYRTIGYRDELLADGSVRRAYSDGRQEWRHRGPGGQVTWRDERDRTGADELLGGRIVKRRIDRGQVIYGRELGYGRTAWSDGILTVNQTSLGGRAGAILAGIGAAGLLPAIVDPPFSLTPAEEEALRQQQAASGGGDSGGGDSGGSGGESSDEPRDEDWSMSDGGADGGTDGDFG